MSDDLTDSTARRRPTPVDALAEQHLAAQAALDPFMATGIGLAGYDTEVPDLSPEGHSRRDDLAAATLAALAEATPADDVDAVTILAMTERLGLQREVHAIGADLSPVRVIASPVQDLRDVFDLMPTETEHDWSALCQRMSKLGTSVAGYLESLRLAASRGDVAPRRQIEAGIEQSGENVGPDGFFARFAASAPESLPESLRTDLAGASQAAQQAYAELRRFLAEELLAQAGDVDAVGPQRYQLYSREFLGATVDLAETYQWGVEELGRIGALMDATAQQILPGASVAEAIAFLDQDASRKLQGTPALREWMQQTSDAAVDALGDTHFDIPGPVRRLECRIAPTTSGVIYYTGPSDDFSRPGRMWWSVPDGVTEFSTWRERTTVYHEGVPGHHLQIGQTVYRRELLNSWRRLASWTSGHGEGWALYAEWLMADLGFMDDPADRLGLLDGQSMRAARVVIDIGVHCGFPAPAEVGGGQWTYDKAWQLLSGHANMAEGFLRFELNRYLGWPGQAPSYKIGERHWLQLRDEVRRREGDAFDLKAFHRRALDIGGVGLDVLRAAVLNELPPRH